MPFEQLVAAQTPRWAFDFGWPYTRSGIAALGAIVGVADRLGLQYCDGIPATSGNDIVLTLPTAGGAFASPTWEKQNGTVCMRTDGGVDPSGFYVGESIVINGPLLADDVPFSVSPSFRCHIDEWYVSWNAAAPVISAEDKPILFLPTDGGGILDIDTSGIVGAQYGIRGDGAGGFEFFSAIGGVLQESVALVWPEADLRAWVKLGVQHKVANGNRAATFELLLNDAVAISRTWEAGTTLPDFSDAVAGTGQMMRRKFRQGVGANLMNIAMVRIRAGGFDVNGEEVS
jgi:hypothetical protein